MGNLSILTITRNAGAITQQYRIQWKKPLDVAWTNGPTLSYNQAQPAPAGLLPVNIVLDPVILAVASLDVRIVTICEDDEGVAIETNGAPVSVAIHNNPCP